MSRQMSKQNKQYDNEDIKMNFRKSRSYKNIQYFILYCYTFLVYGAFINCLGPLIPFLSLHYKIKQTQYSFFFTTRTISYILGSIFIRFYISQFNHHKLIILNNSVIFISSWIFESNQFYIQAISIFLVNAMYSIIDPVLNVLIVEFNQDNDKQFYLLIGHTMFGVGSLIAPIMVYSMGLHTFTILGTVNLIAVIGYYWLKVPIVNKQQEKDKQINHNQINNQINTNLIQSQSIKPQNISQKISNKSLYLLSLLFFFYIGQQVTFGGWIPSYSVMMGFADEKKATMLSSLYYLFVTIFRIIYIFIHTTSTQNDIKLLLSTKLICSFILVFLQQYSPQYTSYLGCFLYSITMAPLYAKFLILPNQFNIQLKGEDFATIVIIGSVGEAALASVTGVMMGMYQPQIFYWCMLIMGVLSYGLAVYTIDGLREQQERNKKNIKQQSKLIQMQTRQQNKIVKSN